MITYLFNKLKLKLNPPRTGDIFHCDPLDIMHFYTDHVLHGLKDRDGDTIWEPVPGNASYRIRIKMSISTAYYVCVCHVLCRNILNNQLEWKERCQYRRIRMNVLHKLVVDGKLIKEHI